MTQIYCVSAETLIVHDIKERGGGGGGGESQFNVEMILY